MPQETQQPPQQPPLASTARVGRENQRYAENGARLVAGCVCVNSARDKVLLIASSAKPNKWVVPKGGVENDERSHEAAAIRETWEEAGVTGRIVGYLGAIEDARPPKHWGSIDKVDPQRPEVLIHPPRSEFHFYEMLVEKEHDVYPESTKRRRAWFSLEGAIEEMERNNRPELATALKRCSLSKTA